MNLSTLQSLTIPEGPVIMITRNGTTIWEKQLGLPADYQQVEYIATDGSQYIDTGVNASHYQDGIGYELDIHTKEISVGSVNYVFLFGSTDTEKTSYSGSPAISFGAGNYRFYCGSGEAKLIYWDDPNGSRRTISAFANSNAPSDMSYKVFVEGEDKTPKIVSFDPVGKPMPDANVYLFKCNGYDDTRPIICQLYGFMMTDASGKTIRNFVPCYRKEDGVIGAFDMVTKQFFTNSGTGAFTKGEDV